MSQSYINIHWDHFKLHNVSTYKELYNLKCWKFLVDLKEDM